MNKFLLLTPFLLGNSAGGLGAIAVVYLIGFIIALVVTIGIIYGAIKYFS
jgi:hypothetical protein